MRFNLNILRYNFGCAVEGECRDDSRSQVEDCLKKHASLF